MTPDPTRVDDLPWLAVYWRRLHAYIESGSIPQALLIDGTAGLGKMRLAQAFAQRLLCRRQDEFACGECPACQLFAARTHPDFILVEPEEAGKPITVDAIRSLIAVLSLKPQYNGRRVVVLAPAQQMNAAAANSLLKTLEEPDEHTLMLLLTESPAALPATILSRCQRLDIAIPAREAALAWLSERNLAEQAQVLLSLAQGAPLRAQALSGEGIIAKRGEFFMAWCDILRRGDEPVAIAEKWAGFSCETLTDWMISWVMDLIRVGVVPHGPRLDNPDLEESLQALSGRLNLQQIYGFLDRLNGAKRSLAGQVNRQLALEELLIHWSRLAERV